MSQPPARGDDYYTDDPIISGLKAFPEFDNQQYKLVVISTQSKTTLSERVKEEERSFLFIDYTVKKRYSVYTTITYATFNVFRWNPIPGTWIPFTQVTAEVDREEKEYSNPYYVPKDKGKDQAERQFEKFMDDVLDYRREKRIGKTEPTSSQQSEPQGSTVPEDAYSVKVYAADVTPDDKIDNWVFIDNRSVNLGFFTETGAALVPGATYSYEQLKSYSQGGQLRDKEKGLLSPDYDYEVVDIIWQGQPRRYKKGFKDMTVILPNSPAQLKVLPKAKKIEDQ